MMKRYPRIWNWVKIIFWVVFGGWCIYLQFYKSYPEVPSVSTTQPYQITGNSIYWHVNEVSDVDAPTVTSKYIDMPISAGLIKTGDSIYDFNSDFNPKSEPSNEPKEVTDLKQLRQEIAELKVQKRDLEDNVKKLDGMNNQLTKINSDMQLSLINFTERHRWSDMLLSAIVGAIVSMILTSILNFPPISKRIQDFLFKIVE